jgi:asparaginyl-tRNA synthetase
MKIRIIDLLKTTTYNINVSVNGWVRTHRQSKNISFIAINDGSTVHNLQIVAEHEKIKKDFLKLVTTGSAIRVDGMFALSTGNQQHGEIIAQNIVLYGTADPQEYPLQKKEHSLDFCGILLIYAYAQIFLAQYFVCAIIWLLPYIVISMKEDSSISILL